MGNLKLAVDLDHTIDVSKQSNKFFMLLSKLFYDCAEIHIVANREPGCEAAIDRELKELGIRYHHLKITANKAQYIRENGIEVYFENTDEYFLELGPEVCVFKIREEGNFDFVEKKWIGGGRSVKMVDE